MKRFDITPEALAQIKRLEAIFRALLNHPSLALPHTNPEDVHRLASLVRTVRRLPEAPVGDDLTLLVHPNRDPRKSFYRLQFGPRVIELGTMQVCADPDNEDEWVALTYFGAVMGLGAGCAEPQYVEELARWIDTFESVCGRPDAIWKVRKGANHLGHAPDPVALYGDDA